MESLFRSDALLGLQANSREVAPPGLTMGRRQASASMDDTAPGKGNARLKVELNSPFFKTCCDFSSPMFPSVTFWFILTATYVLYLVQK